jgi:hypothetical protein
MRVPEHGGRMKDAATREHLSSRERRSEPLSWIVHPSLGRIRGPNSPSIRALHSRRGTARIFFSVMRDDHQLRTAASEFCRSAWVSGRKDRRAFEPLERRRYAPVRQDDGTSRRSARLLAMATEPAFLPTSRVARRSRA